MAEIGLRLGNYYQNGNRIIMNNFHSALDTLRYYYSQFGLGVDTGIDLPENQVNNGLIGDMTQGGSLLHNTFGQYDNYTPLQMVPSGSNQVNLLI